jgi:UDP-glucose 4-epimerase
MILAGVFRDLFGNRTHDTKGMLSIVVNFYNNRREARNTLYSLTRADATLAYAYLDWQASLDLDRMCADAWHWQAANPTGYSK